MSTLWLLMLGKHLGNLPVNSIEHGGLSVVASVPQCLTRNLGLLTTGCCGLVPSAPTCSGGALAAGAGAAGRRTLAPAVPPLWDRSLLSLKPRPPSHIIYS